jgi:ankyrin repeat protein
VHDFAALMLAAQDGFDDVVQLLLDAKAPVNAVTCDNASALALAAGSSHHDVSLLLVDAKATISATEIVEAAGSGSERTVRAFLELKADPNAQQSDGVFPLWVAAQENRVSMCALLLAARAKPDLAFQKCGTTALMHATQRGHCDVVRLLTRSSANVSLRRKRGGFTALHDAARRGYRDACVLMLQAAADNAAALLAAKSKKGSTALRLAARKKRRTTFQLLRDWRGATAFAAQSRKHWRTPPPPEQYCWTKSWFFDVHLIDEITSFLL